MVKGLLAGTTSEAISLDILITRSSLPSNLSWTFELVPHGGFDGIVTILGTISREVYGDTGAAFVNGIALLQAHLDSVKFAATGTMGSVDVWAMGGGG